MASYFTFDEFASLLRPMKQVSPETVLPARPALVRRSYVMRSIVSCAIVAGFWATVAFAAPILKSDGPPRLLVASSNLTGNWEIYLVNPDTGVTKNLTDNKARNTDPAWSPDGKRIAFVSDRDGKPRLWVMRADGTDPRLVAKDSVNCSGPRWSPDGERIAYKIEYYENDPTGGLIPRGNIYCAVLSTGKVTQLTNETFRSGQPAWSPNGKKLAYTYYGEGLWTLNTMDADGSRKAKLGPGHEAAWSPDGKRIAFVSLRNGQGFQVFTCDAEFKDVRSLDTLLALVADSFPQWSPDGKTIAFRKQNNNMPTCQVAVVGENGKGYKLLTSDEAYAHPRWSPDGQSLSYGRFHDKAGYFREGKPSVLFVSDKDGKNAKELLQGYGGAEWCPPRMWTVE